VHVPPKGSDTPLAIAERMLEHWRRASWDDKLDRMFGMAELVNTLARAELKARYPEATEREITLRLASRTLDRETMIKAFDWDPAERGR
jgi:hypothetical protein